VGGPTRRHVSRRRAHKRHTAASMPHTKQQQQPQQQLPPTNAPASAEAQPSVGRRHQRRGSQRCNFEWRRHPLWASCRANYRIHGVSWGRQVWNGRNGRKPKGGSWSGLLSRGPGPEKIWAKIWLQSRSARAPKWRGRSQCGFGLLLLGSRCVAAVRAASRPACTAARGPRAAASGLARLSDRGDQMKEPVIPSRLYARASS
jgi:hypothetical protein